ncbi:MAG: hypothetical protein QW272_05220 [Candidatus Methanomethylicaceae archaeon]
MRYPKHPDTLLIKGGKSEKEQRRFEGIWYPKLYCPKCNKTYDYEVLFPHEFKLAVQRYRYPSIKPYKIKRNRERLIFLKDMIKSISPELKEIIKEYIQAWRKTEKERFAIFKKINEHLEKMDPEYYNYALKIYMNIMKYL